MKTKYGVELRNHLTNYDVNTIIDFFELPVFNAATDSAITSLQKQKTERLTKYFPVKTLANLNLAELTSGSFLSVRKDKEDWKFTKGIEEYILKKIYQNTVSLKEFTDDKIYRGILTGANGVFVLEDDIAESLLKTESWSIIRPYAEPTTIKKWEIVGKRQYFLATGYDLNIPEDYPSAFEYLSKHIQKLKDRQDKGKDWWNLRPCKYYQDFDKPKLIYIYTAKNHYFYYDTEGYYINNSSYMIVTENKFLCAFLNSKLFNWFKRIKFVAYGDAEDKGRVKLDYNKMETVPIKQITPEAQRPFEVLVDELLALKKEEQNNNKTYMISDGATTHDLIGVRVKELEAEIDRLVYQLYGLTAAEIGVVEGGK